MCDFMSKCVPAGPRRITGRAVSLPTTSRVLLLAAAFSVAATNALPHRSRFDSRPTITSTPPYSNSRSLIPRSTAASLSLFGTWPESTVSPAVCGWIGGDPYSPVTCNYGNSCVWDSANGVVGCCPDEGSCTGSETGIYTSCVDSRNPQTVVSPNVMSCAGTSQCYENLYPGGYIQYNCGVSTDATTVATALPELAFSLVPVFTSLLFPASTSASLASTSSSAPTSSSTTSSATITPSPTSSAITAAAPTALLGASTSSSSGTQTRKTVGIVLGVVIGTALMACLAVFMYWRRRSSGKEIFPDPYHSALTSVARNDSTKVDYGREGERTFGSGDKTLGGDDTIDTIASTPLIGVSAPMSRNHNYNQNRLAGFEAFGNSELALSPITMVTTITANTSPVRPDVSPLSRTISHGLDLARSLSSQSFSAIFGEETTEEMARARAARSALGSRRASAAVDPLNIRPQPPRKSSKRKFFLHLRRPSTPADSFGADLSMVPTGLSSIVTGYHPLDGVGGLENVGAPIDGLALGLIGAGAGAMDYRPGTASTAASGTVGSVGVINPGLPPGATTRTRKLSPELFRRPVRSDIYDPHPGTRLDLLSIGSAQHLSVMDGVGSMVGAGLMPMRVPSAASSLNQGCRSSIRANLEREGLVDIYTKDLVESLDGGAGLASDAASLYGREEIFNTSSLGYGGTGYCYGTTHYGIGMREEKEGLLADTQHGGNYEHVGYGGVEGIVHPALRTKSDSRQMENEAAQISATRTSTAKEEESGREMHFEIQDRAQNTTVVNRNFSLPRSARVELSSAGSGLTGRTTSTRKTGNASESQVENRQREYTRQAEMTPVNPKIWGFAKVGERAPGERGEIGGSDYNSNALKVSGGSTRVPILRKPVPGVVREGLKYDI